MDDSCGFHRLPENPELISKGGKTRSYCRHCNSPRILLMRKVWMHVGDNIITYPYLCEYSNKFIYCVNCGETMWRRERIVLSVNAKAPKLKPHLGSWGKDVIDTPSLGYYMP